MADSITTPAVGTEPVTPAATPEPKSVVLKEGEKVFNQTQIDDIVKGRLADDRKGRQVDAEAKYETSQTSLTKAQTELEVLKNAGTDAEATNKALQGTYDELLKLIPDTAKPLVPAHGSLSERLSFINTNRDTFFPKPVAPVEPAATAAPAAEPTAPPPNAAGAASPAPATPSPLPGGYATEMEFQNADPHGYIAWEKKQMT